MESRKLAVQGIAALQAQQQGHRGEEEEKEGHQQQIGEGLADDPAEPAAEGVDGAVGRGEEQAQDQDDGRPDPR